MNRLNTDVLVIGSGIAGLQYAIRCSAFAKVLVVTKGSIGESNTMYAQGGIAAVFDKRDSVENHINDTLIAGDGLCNKASVRLIAESARQCILDLCESRVEFDKDVNGAFELHREGGHSFNRIVHTADATGKEVETSLVHLVRSNKNISVFENAFAVDFVTQNNTCIGATVICKTDNEVFDIRAKIVMLATGGCGQVYLQNTNPAIATGDGFAMAQRAGAAMANMEFVQFHPTTLYAPGKETFLISEAVRGFGVPLTNKEGQQFMDQYHPQKSLAPRDIVSRAIVSEMHKSGASCVYLDARSFNLEEVEEHFPNIYRTCVENGLDLRKDLIPVVPAAHYMCGGVVTDLCGRTSVVNLFACGEVSCTGVHGANRLASNSLLEGLAFAQQAAKVASETLASIQLNPSIFKSFPLNEFPEVTELEPVKNHLREIMWQHAGITRDNHGLEICLEELHAMDDVVRCNIRSSQFSVQRMELQNMIACGIMIVQSAILRLESRGCHYRTDFPEKNITNDNTVMQFPKTALWGLLHS